MDESLRIIEEALRLEERRRQERQEQEMRRDRWGKAVDAYERYKDSLAKVYILLHPSETDPACDPVLLREVFTALCRVRTAFEEAGLADRWPEVDQQATQDQYSSGWRDKEWGSLAFRYGCHLLGRLFRGELTQDDINRGWDTRPLRGCYGMTQLLLNGLMGGQAIKCRPKEPIPPVVPAADPLRVPAEATRPKSPEPPAALVEAAGSALLSVLADLQGDSPVTLAVLLREIGERSGHGKAACEWAIHRLVEHDLLLLRYAEHGLPSVRTHDLGEEPGWFGGGRGVDRSLTRAWVEATPALWQRWRESDAAAGLRPAAPRGGEAARATDDGAFTVFNQTVLRIIEEEEREALALVTDPDYPPIPELRDCRREARMSRFNDHATAAFKDAIERGIPREEVDAKIAAVGRALSSLMAEPWWQRFHIGDEGAKAAARADMVQRIEEAQEARMTAFRLSLIPAAALPQRASVAPALPPVAKQSPPQLAGSGPPAVYLLNWCEILDALGQKNGEESRRRIRQLNEDFEGPIIPPPRGGQPKVEKTKLLAWWNGLEKRFGEMKQRREDSATTLEARHDFGKGGIVLPDIAGGIKKRRKGRGK